MDAHPPLPHPHALARRLALVAAVVLVAAAGFGLVASCSGSDAPAGTGRLIVRSVRVDEPVNGRSAAVRLVIDNQTDTDDVLLSVTSPEAGRATGHRSGIDAEGRASMAAVDRLPIPAGKATTFRSGGLHVMLEQFTSELEVGTEVQLTLTFDRAGTRTVTGTVVSPGAADDADDMDHMDHGG